MVSPKETRIQQYLIIGTKWAIHHRNSHEEELSIRVEEIHGTIRASTSENPSSGKNFVFI